MQKILIADYVPDFFVNGILERGFEIELLPEISNDEMNALPDDYVGVLIKSNLYINESFLNNHPCIRLILRPGSGLDTVDLPLCKKFGVDVISSPEGNCNAVAEHAVGMLLCMLNHIPRAINQVRQGEWIREANRGRELEGMKVGVIGVGHTGSHFIKKLEGFDVEILPHDKYLHWIPSISKQSVSLDTIFGEADVCSLHLPLTDETHYYANDSFFDSFSKPIYFINTSRGKICESKALLRAIENGKVLQAALDVIENENFKSHTQTEKELLKALIETERVIITPHIAGWTIEAKLKMFKVLLNKYDSLTKKN